MPELEKSTSVVFYDHCDVLGYRSINSLGCIMPILPLDVRQRETAVRVACAEKIAPFIHDTLTAGGFEVSHLRLTGSTASGFADPDSDIDFEVGIVGEEFTEFSSHYFERSKQITNLMYTALNENAGEVGRGDYRDTRFFGKHP